MELALEVRQDDDAIHQPLKDEDPQPKKKSRSGTPGWAKFNRDRAEKKRLEVERLEILKKKKMEAIPTHRVHGKQTVGSVRPSSRSINHNVVRLDEDWRYTKVDAATQTEVTEHVAKGSGSKPSITATSTSTATYLKAIAASNVYLRHGPSSFIA